MSEGSPRFVTQMLHTTVWFAGMSMPAELFGRCVALSEAVPLFDVARECLRALSPRKRLETGMKHTVRKRGTKGREFAHGELADAVAYRDRLRVAGTLADFGRYVGVHPPLTPIGPITRRCW